MGAKAPHGFGWTAVMAGAASTNACAAPSEPQSTAMWAIANAALLTFIVAFLVWGHCMVKYHREIQTAVTRHLGPRARLGPLDHLSLFVAFPDPGWLYRHVEPAGRAHISEARRYRTQMLSALLVCLATGLVIWLMKPAA